MGILLTNEQIKEITEMQRILDKKIRENNEIDENKDLNMQKYIALKTEFFEFVNEIESFKYWKKNKGKEHILEEACDTLHFILSLAIDNKHEIILDEKYLDNFDMEKQDLNELICITDAMITDLGIEGEFILLNGVLTSLCIILHICGHKSEELYNAYIEKNKVNHIRQDTNY